MFTVGSILLWAHSAKHPDIALHDRGDRDVRNEKVQVETRLESDRGKMDSLTQLMDHLRGQRSPVSWDTTL